VFPDDQGVVAGSYTVVPRTLTFLVHGDALLLLRGAPTKRLWAGRLNGLGGHVEPGEGIAESARREVLEETGLHVQDLSLRGLVHVAGMKGVPGVLLFVFVGKAPTRDVTPSREGHLEWHSLSDLPFEDMVEDLGELLPRILTGEKDHRLTYGHYAPSRTGELEFRFVP